MTTQLVTNYLRLHNVKQFRESVSEAANSVYYAFISKHTPFTGGDSVVPAITNTVEETFQNVFSNLLFGKRVTTADINALVPRYTWTTGTVYVPYRSNTDLTGKQFFVIVSEGGNFNFFKCLDNRANTASTVPPALADTSAADDFYSTSDGYVWKYMCSVTSSTFNKFATTNWAPVTASATVSGNAISGAIDFIQVSYAGSHYNTTFANTFLSGDLRVGGDPLKYNLANNASAANGFYVNSFIYITGGAGVGQGKRIVDYTVSGSNKQITIESTFSIVLDVTSSYQVTPYVPIVGDGSGAIARAIVNTSLSNSVTRVEMVQRGTGYTFATATVVGNTGGVANAATLAVVNGPKGGHGFDVEYELGATALGVAVQFANTESGTISIKNDFRQIGIIKDPLFANVVYTVASVSGRFTTGETVTQNTSGASAVVADWDSISTLRLTNVNGIFITGNVVVGSTSAASANLQSYTINGIAKNFNTFDQRSRFSFSSISGTFTADEQVTQTAGANGYFHSNDATNIYLTNVQGTMQVGNTITGANSAASSNLTAAWPGDIVKGSGEVIYVENVNPVSRSATQTETLKFVLEF